MGGAVPNPKHYLFVDERLLGQCVYCGAMPESRDHVPPKIFLDDPLSESTSVVESCSACNQGASLDEEYLACFLESVLYGSSHEAQRPKVRAALDHNPRLAARIEACARVDGARKIWVPEVERVRNVILKLSRGHTAYELSLAQTDEPVEVSFTPLLTMSTKEREEFETCGAGEIRGWPEIGSRAFFRAAGAHPFADTAGPWIVVQPGRYRYLVDQNAGVEVRIVISEYLACLVTWE